MFQIKDRVRTLQRLEEFVAGAEGVVIDIDSNGNLIVNLVRDANGRVFNPPQPLLPHEPRNFERI